MADCLMQGAEGRRQVTDDCPLRGTFVKGARTSRHRHGLLIPIFCLLSSVFCPLNAEELLDPTRPPDSLSAPVIAAAGGAVAVQPLGLQSIIISKNRRVAIIDGEAVELGDNYGDAKLIEVNEGSVILQGAQGRQVLTLFPDVTITGKQGIRISPLSPTGGMRSGGQKNGPVVRKEGR